MSQPSRFACSRKSRALLAGAAVLLAGYVVLATIVAFEHADALDRGVRSLVQPLRHADALVLMALVSRLGDATGLVPLILAASLVLWRRDRRWALLLPAVMAGTGALQYLTKWLADRPRPNELPWGFPSGHVLSLAVFLGLVLYLTVTLSSRRRRVQLLACAACAGTLVTVAWSRIYLDMHWLSDVGGGFALGLAYLFITIWMAEVTARGGAPVDTAPLALAGLSQPDSEAESAPAMIASGGDLATT